MGLMDEKVSDLLPTLRAKPATCQIQLKESRDRTFLINPLDCLAKQGRH